MIRKGEALEKSFWLVDKILSHRRGMSEIEYKVKWLGLPEADCTWQPESTMCVQRHVTNGADAKLFSVVAKLPTQPALKKKLTFILSVV